MKHTIASHEQPETAELISIDAGGHVRVGHKYTDVALARKDHYRVYKRADQSVRPAMRLADKIGSLIGMRCFAVADHARGRTTEAEVIEAVRAAL